MNSIRSKTDQDKYPDLQQLHSLFQVKMLLHTFLNFLILCFPYLLYSHFLGSVCVYWCSYYRFNTHYMISLICLMKQDSALCFSVSFLSASESWLSPTAQWQLVYIKCINVVHVSIQTYIKCQCNHSGLDTGSTFSKQTLKTQSIVLIINCM